MSGLEPLALAAVGMQVAGGTLGAGAQLQSGYAQEAISGYQARELERQAGEEMASGQREAIEQRRQADIAQSRAKAVAAASGAGASDKTVVDIMEGIEREGEYRALSSLFESDSRARQGYRSAAARRIEGADAKRASEIGAAGTILSTGGSLMSKYG